MLKYLLYYLSLSITAAKIFKGEVDYSLLYSFMPQGFTIGIMQYQNNTIAPFKTGCEYNFPFYQPNSNIPAYSFPNYQTKAQFTMKSERDTVGNRTCEYALLINDGIYRAPVAYQPFKYNGKDDTYNVGFFKPLLSNTIIESDEVNDLSISNEFFP